MIEPTLVVLLSRPANEYQGENGEPVALTPLIAYDTFREVTFSGIAVNTFSFTHIISVACDPLTAWKSLRFFETAKLSVSDDGGIHIAMEGFLSGEETELDSLEAIIEKMTASLGDIYPPDEEIVMIWDNLPSGTIRTDFGFKLKRAMCAGIIQPSHAVLSRIGRPDKGYKVLSC